MSQVMGFVVYRTISDFFKMAKHHKLPPKAYLLLRILSSSLKLKYVSMNMSVPSEEQVLVSLCTDKTVTLLMSI